MSTTTLEKPTASPAVLTTPEPKQGEPVWALAELLHPRQGEWSESDYLHLDTNVRIEFADGSLEFISMPSNTHEAIALFFYRLLYALVEASKLGLIRVSGTRVRTIPGKFRLPDVMVLLNDSRDARNEDAWDTANLVVEVVSPDDPSRDYQKKRTEYAAAGIREYWIVDPAQRHILVLTLDAGQTTYREVGTFRDDAVATSVLIDGFNVKPNDVWASVQSD